MIRNKKGGKKRRIRNGIRGTSKTTRTRSKVNGSTNITPPRTFVWLPIQQLYTLGTAAGGQVVANYVTPNGIWKYDSSLTSTTPGFASMAARYAMYRVHAYKGWISFACATTSTTLTTNAMTMVCHANTNLGITQGTSSHTNIQQAAGLEFNTTRPAGCPGAPPAVHRFNHKIARIAGEPIIDDNFAATTSAVPTNLTYLIFGIFSSAESAVSQAWNVVVSVKVLTEFFEYVDTLTSQGDSKLFRTFAKCAECTKIDGSPYLPCCSVIAPCPICSWIRPCIQGHRHEACLTMKPLLLMSPPLLEKQNSKKCL